MTVSLATAAMFAALGVCVGCGSGAKTSPRHKTFPPRATSEPPADVDPPAPYVPRPSGALIFAADIEPLVRKKCAACRRVGGIGPFPLLTHADVQKRARQMVDVTRRRLMPPRAPLPNYCRFDHDLSLTANESGMIAQ